MAIMKKLIDSASAKTDGKDWLAQLEADEAGKNRNQESAIKYNKVFRLLS